MNKKNVTELMQEILKFRDRPLKGQTNYIHQGRCIICAAAIWPSSTIQRTAEGCKLDGKSNNERLGINVHLPLNDLKIEINLLQPKTDLASKLGFASDYRMGGGTDVFEDVIKLCREIKSAFNHFTVFTWKLIFRLEQLFNNLLHNETAFAIYRKPH